MGIAEADHSTLANPTLARVRHAAYELDVDFSRQVIEGYVQLDVEVLQEAVQQLRLDTSGLRIAAATVAAPGAGAQPAAFELGPTRPALGTQLSIILPAGLAAGDAVHVGVRFATDPGASALQWLDPAQTAGGVHPYLFTQCQAIHARSFVPCQDTPSVKSTYTAAVRVPAALTALMSAVSEAEGAGGAAACEELPHLADAPAPAGPTRVFRFEQKVPIPSYLLALAVGELAARELSVRSRVWSEPSVVDAAAFEFADTARYLEAGEALAGEYVWGRYDLLLLPPSFPYGGMENPCLTFVTPTLLAGDRSLTNVVAHEIAHSWSGNLVTNASWQHFWLNEGWTVFLERKILGRLQGEAALQFRAARGAADLADDVARIGAAHPFTALVPDLSAGQDPDDAFSRVPYEKGFYFLYYLQTLVGGPSAFEPFMRHYFKTFAFRTVTSEEFRRCFEQHFRDVAAAQQVDWDAWLHAPGMPPPVNTYDTHLAQEAYDLATRWHTSDVMGIGAPPPAGVGPGDMDGWSSDMVVAFLEKLLELRSLTPLAAATTRALAALYGLDASKNCEQRVAWYRLSIAAEDEAVLSGVAEMLEQQGRMKYLRPLYRALHRSRMGRHLAADLFERCANRYHPIARKMVAADLAQPPPAA